MKNKAKHLYLEHFQLKEAPFLITPTTDFFYGGGRRGEILHALLYALNVGEGIVMVTGEVGSGKTMMLRMLVGKLPDDVETIYIANPSLSGSEILYNLCEELGLKAEQNRPDTVRLLQNYLIEAHKQGRRVVAFIDEAQAMPDESLEEIRLLSNLETSRDKLLQIFLFGQPELVDKISRQTMRQLRERISVKLKLQPFNRDDVREYIATRLHVAGYNGGLFFSSQACHLIAVISQGLSRRINVLADKSMLSAYERGSLKVNFSDVRRAVKDVGFGKVRYRSEQSRRFSRQLTIGVGLASCFLLILVVGIRLFGDDRTVAATTATVQQTVAVQLETPTPAAATNTAAGDDTPPAETVKTTINTAESSDDAPLTADNKQREQPAEQNTVRNDEQELRAAIADLNQGRGLLDGDELAEELAASAENHVDEPQAEGGEATWQSVARTEKAAINNRQWDWMPASSFLRNRLNATQTWLAKSGQDNFYTARLMTVGRERAVFLEKFLRYFADFYPIRNIMVYPSRLAGGEKFVVTYGVYQARKDVDIFLNNLPYYFTGGRPFAQILAESIDESTSEWNPQ